jgi:hypothetical protein
LALTLYEHATGSTFGTCHSRDDTNLRSVWNGWKRWETWFGLEKSDASASLHSVCPLCYPFVLSAIRLSSLQSVCPLCNPFVLSAICLSSLQSVCLMHTTVLNCWHWQTSQCGAINTTSKTRNRSGHPQSLRTSSTSAISLAVSPAARLAGTQTIPPALPLPRHRVERNKKQCNFAGALSFTPPLL